MYVWYINMAPRPPCNESETISAVQQQTKKNHPRKIDTFCEIFPSLLCCSRSNFQLWSSSIVSYLQTTLITSACRIPSSARMAPIEVSRLVDLVVWASKKKIWRRNIVFFLTSQLLSFQTSLCPAVICPYPNTQPGDNHSTSVPLVSPGGNGTMFEQWWSKTNTVPLYLIVLLLPLLCFRSASFFARFTFLGEKPPFAILSCQL